MGGRVAPCASQQAGRPSSRRRGWRAAATLTAAAAGLRGRGGRPASAAPRGCMMCRGGDDGAVKLDDAAIVSIGGRGSINVGGSECGGAIVECDGMSRGDGVSLTTDDPPTVPVPRSLLSARALWPPPEIIVEPCCDTSRRDELDAAVRGGTGAKPVGTAACHVAGRSTLLEIPEMPEMLDAWLSVRAGGQRAPSIGGTARIRCAVSVVSDMLEPSRLVRPSLILRGVSAEASDSPPASMPSDRRGRSADRSPDMRSADDDAS